MKKLVITLAVALIIATTGCGDSKSPIVTYVARSNSDGAPHLFTLNEATKTPTAVSISIPTNAYYVASNSDATAVTYSRDDDSGFDIFLMGTDGVEHQLTTGAEAYSPVFSPDGKTIAFYSYQNNGYLVYTMNADGSNQQPAYSTDSSTWIYYPGFSPDGKSLVFYVETGVGPSAQHHGPVVKSSWLRHGNRSKTSVHTNTASGITTSGWYVMALTDSAPTFVYAATDVWGPAVFSGDGKKLLFTQYDGTTDNIFSVNLDGSGLTPLTTSTDSNTYNFSPVPYKNLIVFNQNNQTNSSWDIYVMNQDGTNPQLVHSTASTWEILNDSYWGD